MLEIRGDKDQQDYKRDMERMRLQTLYLVNMQLEKSKQFKSTKSLMPFDWDHEEVTQIAPQPTEQEYQLMDKISAGGKR